MSDVSQDAAKAAKKASAKALAWEQCRLRYLLDSNQRKVYDAIENCTGGSFYFNKPRRVGGSYLLTVRAVEQCLKKPNAQVRYAAPTAKTLRKIVRPNLQKVLKDCPNHLRPKWSSLEQEYRFPNGSILAIAGCDAQRYEDLRGTEADEIYMDEVGFIDELDYILNDVLLPQVQDTGGRVILVSTPPRSPGHPAAALAKEHQMAGQYYACEVWDNPRKTKAQHELFFKRIARGMPLDTFYKTTMFRREYLAEIIVDEERAVIPEFTREARRTIVTDTIKRPSRFDSYVGIDLGTRDGTAAVFGYWDWPDARLVIENELLLRGHKTLMDTFVDEARHKEFGLWGDKKPLKRISDNDTALIQEMNHRGYHTQPAHKPNKEARVNALRELVAEGKLVIHERCVKLIAQLETTIWNTQRSEFVRTAEGHGDLLDALIYMHGAISKNRDPTDRKNPNTDFDVFRSFDRQETAKGLEGALQKHWKDWGVA